MIPATLIMTDTRVGVQLDGSIPSIPSRQTSPTIVHLCPSSRTRSVTYAMMESHTRV